MTRLRAKFDGKVIVPEGPVDLPTGELLDVSVDLAAHAELPPGSPARILKTLMSIPTVTPEEAAEFERAIEEGKLPLRSRGEFDAT
jgi:hypothetical protein